MALLDEPATSPSSASIARTGAFRRSAPAPAGAPPGARIADLYGLSRTAPPTRARGSITAAGASAIRSARASETAAAAGLRFLPAEGESLHQIPVGPVHAGIIEPGHFRFTANGETVVRLEERLGYVHKGIESLMTGADLDTAAKLAGRTSGDATVAYAWRSRAPSRPHWCRGAPRAPIISAPSWPSSSGSPITSAISARSATMRPSR